MIDGGASALFIARTNNSGDDGISQLWKTDGTAEGTIRLLEYNAAPLFSSSRELVAAGNQAFFVARTSKHGAELWRSDGTVEGTRRVADIAAGKRSSRIGELTAVGRNVYFSANDGVHGRELWRSDGTATGTRMLADLHPAGADTAIGELTPFGDRLFFLSRMDARTSGAPMLGVTDGSSAGTKLIFSFSEQPYGTLVPGVPGFLC